MSSNFSITYLINDIDKKNSVNDYTSQSVKFYKICCFFSSLAVFSGNILYVPRSDEVSYM